MSWQGPPARSAVRYAHGGRKSMAKAGQSSSYKEPAPEFGGPNQSVASLLKALGGRPLRGQRVSLAEE
jgi:hypothetical protein